MNRVPPRGLLCNYSPGQQLDAQILDPNRFNSPSMLPLQDQPASLQKKGPSASSCSENPHKISADVAAVADSPEVGGVLTEEKNIKTALEAFS